MLLCFSRQFYTKILIIMNTIESRTCSLLFTALLIINIALGLYFAFKHSFIQDDAFISFRYAQNLISGRGLVYNTGERVEGYSNFLWTLMIALFMYFGKNPVIVSRTLSVFFYLLMTVTVHFYCLNFLKSIKNKIGFLDLLPLVSLLLIPLNESSSSYATGGLETSCFSFFIMLSFFLCLFTRNKNRLLYLSSNISLLLLCLTRPEGLFFYFVINIFIFLDLLSRTPVFRKVFMDILRWNIPFILLFAIYLMWKWQYYGSILPNTYYAKSVSENHFYHGAVYLFYFFISYYYLLPIVFLLVFSIYVFIKDPGGLKSDTPISYAQKKYYFPLIISYFLFLIYIAKVGGDFMEYKPIMHIYPCIITSFCLCLMILGCKNGRFAVITPFILLIVVSMAVNPAVKYPFGVQSVEALNESITREGGWAETGKILRKKLPPETIISTAAAGAIPYYSELTTIDYFGLNDRAIAIKSTSDKNRSGHRKMATRAYLVSRGVNLIFHPAQDILPCSDIKTVSGYDLIIRLSRKYCLKAVYLIKKDKLSRHFESHPEDFILQHD